MAPAIRLAKEGYDVDSALARSIAGKANIHRASSPALTFFFRTESPSRWERVSFSRTSRGRCETIAREGANGFYKGKIAQLIADEMQRGCPRASRQKPRIEGCGIITREDLARYKPVWRKPITTGYRGYTLLTMPPSSSGGVTITETLNILDGFPTLPPFGSAEYVHLLGSAYQRAFIDRNEKLADPAFVQVPVASSPAKYAAQLRATIGANRATPTESIAVPSREGMETTHYSVVDEAATRWPRRRR